MILCIKIDDICYVYRYQRQTYKQLQGKIAGLMAEYEAVPPLITTNNYLKKIGHLYAPSVLV
jgi:hypothetical protein